MQRQRPRREPEEGAASASFGYGILVNVHTLIVAAKAFANFSIDAHTLDLILNRRSPAVAILSTLSPTPNASLQALPIEVILIIRKHLLELHLDATPNALFERHRDCFEGWDVAESGADFSSCDCPVGGGIECVCSEETKSGRERAEQLGNPAKWDAALWDVHDSADGCGDCREDLSDGTYFHRDDNMECTTSRCNGTCEEKTVGQIRALLRAYGLSLPSAILVNNPYDNEGRRAVVAIILPTRAFPPSPPPDFPSRPPLNAAHSYLSPKNLAIPEYVSTTLYDPSVFIITPEEDLRFVRLARDLRLDVALPEAGGGSFVSKGSLSGDAGAILVKDEGDERAEGGTGDEKAKGEGKPVKPAFMLLHAASLWNFS